MGKFSYMKAFHLLRRLHSSGSNARVRFAPSPTGYLHLGGLRTALYNFLFARANGGTFILRIEDTDRTRLIHDAVEQIQKDLEWLNIKPDEGPKYGGPVGPYFQSERKEMYRKEAERLISSGSAYYCFCTEKRLDLVKREAIRSQQVPKYDNHCRHLSESALKEKLSSGINKCIRLKLTSAEPFNDLVYGKIMHEVSEVEGDPILLKTDGMPTYHLANVVDDVNMKISHVIRGVEWIQSTNKHLMIYKALGYEPPKFAHLPLILNKDGTKLSKRQGDLSVKHLREKGILPNALINFVIQAGGGFNEKPKMNSTLDELIPLFDLSAISTNSSRLPLDRLEEFNRLEFSRQFTMNQELDSLVSEVKKLILQTFSNSKIEEISLELDENHIKTILKWSLPRITTLHDLVSVNLKFLWVKPSMENTNKIEPELLNALINELRNLDFEEDQLKQFFKNFANVHNIPFKELMMLTRGAITGLKQGPGVAEMLFILGKDTSLKRMEYLYNSLIRA